MQKEIPAPAQVLSQGDGAQDESVLDILRLISAGSPLPEILQVVARLVESQAKGMFCTIWVPDEDENYLYCAAAPSLPGFSEHVGRTEICPKGASWGIELSIPTPTGRVMNATIISRGTGSPVDFSARIKKKLVSHPLLKLRSEKELA